MTEADTTIHMMVRDEFPSVVFSLMSVLPGAKKAIVVDTGSTDGTRDWLKTIQRLYPEKIRLVFRDDVPDSTAWSFSKYNPPNKKLSEIRKWMIDETETPFIWIVDGDEVYRDITVKQVMSLFQGWPSGIRVIYVPLLWFVRDIYTLGTYQPGSYPVTGRLFVREGLSMTGTFPGEMHCGPNGEDLGLRSHLALRANWLEPFHHTEMIGKPFRRRILSMQAYDGPQPEVYQRYGHPIGDGRVHEVQDSVARSNNGVGKDSVKRQDTRVCAG